MIATMVLTFITGLSLCAAAEETLGLATGTVLLLATLAMAPLSVVATSRRPSHIEEKDDGVVLTAGGLKHHIHRADLLIHQVDRSRIALDRAGERLIYIDELKPRAKRDVLHLLTRLAGYDVTTPAFAARRLSHRQINPELRFGTWPSAATAICAAVTVLGVAAVVLTMLYVPRTFAPILLAALLTCSAMAVALHLNASTVKRDPARMLLSGRWGPATLDLEEMRVEEASSPTGLTLVVGARRVRLHRFLFKAKEWHTLVGLLSRTLGYDVTEPATEAARLAKLAKGTA